MINNEDSAFADPVAIGIMAAFNQARNDFSARDQAFQASQGRKAELRSQLSAQLARQMAYDQTRQEERDFRAEQAALTREAQFGKQEEGKAADLQRVMSQAGWYYPGVNGEMVLRTPEEYLAWKKAQVQVQATTKHGGGGVKIPKGLTVSEISLISRLDAGSKDSDEDKITKIMRFKPGLSVDEARNALDIARSQSPYVNQEKPPGPTERRSQNIKRGLEAYRYLRTSKKMKPQEALFEAARDAGVTMEELAGAAGAAK